jgi:signal peptidase I
MPAAAVVITALAAALLWLRGRLFVVTVEGRSMEPFLRAGQRALARRVPRGGVRAGQVVVITRPELGPAAEIVGWDPGRWMVKRAAAVSGDSVPRVLTDTADTPTVPPGRILVLGDNPAVSLDSRTFGPVPAERVMGVVIRRMRLPV